MASAFIYAVNAELEQKCSLELQAKGKLAVRFTGTCFHSVDRHS